MTRRKQTGVAVVELAFVITPMLLLCLGVTELGRALYQYDGVVKAARGAARYLTQQNLNDADSYNTAVAIATSMAVCAKPPPAPNASYAPCGASDAKLVPGLDNESQVMVALRPGVATGAGSVSLVSVTIGDSGSKAVKFKSMLPIPGSWLDSFSFAPVAITMAYSTT